MPDIFDYLDWRGDIPITADGFNDADRVVLAQVTYLDFKGMIPENSPLPVPLGELCRRIVNDTGEGAADRFHLHSDRQLAERLIDCPRFKNLPVVYYDEKFDAETVEQFAAMTILLPDRTAACLFRGTDWTLVGWKEDLNMALSDELPAQLHAVEYINSVISSLRGTVRILGHSKGGNLAVYSAAFTKYSRNILEAVSLDGPGYTDRVLSSPGYRVIEPRIRTIIPYSSLVGVIFAHTGRYTIVSSSAPKLMQHDLYTWQIKGSGLVEVNARDEASRLAEGALNEWISGLSTEQRGQFIDGIWSVFETIGITDLPDLLDGRNTIAVIRALTKLDEPTRNVIIDTLSKLRLAVKQQRSK